MDNDKPVFFSHVYTRESSFHQIQMERDLLFSYCMIYIFVIQIFQDYTLKVNKVKVYNF